MGEMDAKAFPKLIVTSVASLCTYGHHGECPVKDFFSSMDFLIPFSRDADWWLTLNGDQDFHRLILPCVKPYFASELGIYLGYIFSILVLTFILGK